MAQNLPRSGKSMLPTMLTQFIGRQQELADIHARLEDPACRLLTLVGPGGTGKTRLAAEAARAQHGRFPDGVFWVDLQAVTAVDFLATAVADALALPQSGSDPRTALLSALQAQDMLLVLDNFEQLRDGAELLTAMLHAAPDVKLLITSREALSLQEEWLYPVSGLPIPRDNVHDWTTLQTNDAVRLFVACARRVRPSFQPEPEMEGILQVCRLVEGIPLALELAATWARALDAAAIAAEIRSNLDFLTAGAQNVPDRHRSMQTIFDHAWARLSPVEQAAFRQMAVFRGGLRREAASAIVDADLPLLTNLVDRSLLRWDVDGRYQMHSLLQQYAAAQAARHPAELADAHRRHAIFYMQFLHERTPHVLGGRQQAATQEIAAELDNIRAAWEWALTQDRLDILDQAVEALSMFCQLQSKYLEGRRLFAQVARQLAAAPGAQPLLARVLSELGWFHIRLGQFDAAENALRRCQAIYQARRMQPPRGHSTDPRLGLSSLAAIRGEYQLAATLAEQALTTASEQGNGWNVATANYLLAEVARAQGRYEQAQQYAMDAYAATESTQDRWFMAYCLYELGQTAAALGDFAQARQHLSACHALRETFADPEGMALALSSLGDVAYRQHQLAEAHSLFAQSLALYRQINDRGGLAAAHHGLGRTAVARREYDEARQALREALQITAEIRFITFQLAVLVDVGDLLLRTGRVAPGLALLKLVETHPAADQETRAAAARRLRHYETAVPPDQFTAAAPPADLDAGAALALAALLTPATAVPDAPPAPPAAESAQVEPLTARELEVLQHLAQGLTNQQIADALSVVEGTIKAHNNRIYDKLGVSSRLQAVTRARELGLIP